MPTEHKRQQVALLQERLERAQVAIGLDYRGLSVSDMQQLRRALRADAPDLELRVIKNTLWKRAVDDAGHPDAANLAQQATALLFGFDGPTDAPKALRNYLRSANQELTIHGVWFENAFNGPETLDALADIPSRPQLMANLAGGLNSPVTGIAATIHAAIRDIAAIIDARADQLQQEDAPDDQPQPDPEPTPDSDDD